MARPAQCKQTLYRNKSEAQECLPSTLGCFWALCVASDITIVKLNASLVDDMTTRLVLGTSDMTKWRHLIGLRICDFECVVFSSALCSPLRLRGRQN